MSTMGRMINPRETKSDRFMQVVFSVLMILVAVAISDMAGLGLFALAVVVLVTATTGI